MCLILVMSCGRPKIYEEALIKTGGKVTGKTLEYGSLRALYLCQRNTEIWHFSATDPLFGDLLGLYSMLHMFKKTPIFRQFSLCPFRDY